MRTRDVVATALAVSLLAACTVEAGSTRSGRPPGPVPPAAESGGGTQSYVACYAAPRSSGGAEEIGFSDATADEALVDPLLGVRAHATAVGDVDGDGWPDLFVGTFADRPADTYRVRGADGPAPDRLLLGGPDGFHVDDSFPPMQARTSGAAFADLDGDSDLDLVVARNPREGERADPPSIVLRNDDGKFAEAGVLDERRRARSVGVLDYDGDDDLDLFLVEDRFGGGSSVLLRNDSDLAFSDATADAKLPRDVHGFGVSVADLTGDDHPDLFVSGSNRLFVNRGEGRFSEVATPVPKWERHGAEDDVAGVATGDLNGDARPDLVIGQHYNSTVDEGKKVAVRAYLNEGVDDDGAPKLRDITKRAGLAGLPTKAPHVEIVDLDADGRPDLLTSASAADGTRPAVFHHRGIKDGIPRFEPPAGLGSPQYWPTGATFDADRDGRLDVFMAEFEPQRPSSLFRNETDAGHWLGVELGPAGTGGIGATVEVFRSGASGEQSQRLGIREITASTGYGAGAMPAAHFGLGDAVTVDVVVHTRDRREAIELDDVPVDRLIEVGSDSCASEASKMSVRTAPHRRG